MKRNLLFIFVIILIISMAVSVMVYGVNTVCNNMNTAYIGGGKGYVEGSAEASDCKGETCIPCFLSFCESEPYLYELSIMGNSLYIDIKKYAECANMLKSTFDAWIDNIKIE